MEAIFLVGGKGTRLMPLTLETPKPMLKLAGVPFIAHQIAYAKAHGITRIIVATSYKTEKFSDYLGKGSRFGVEIVVAIESEPLGTGGAIANAAQLLESGPSEAVAILNGDILSAHDIGAQVSLHKKVAADATLHLIEVDDARAYGSVPTDKDGRILEFVEKSENPPTRFINAGCYIFNRSLIDLIPVNQVVSVERETFPQLLAADKRLWGYQANDYWIDIGTPAALLAASRDLLTRKFASPEFAPSDSQTFIDSGASIDSSATIGAGCAIGDSIIGASAVIESSIIGDGSVVGAGAVIRSSIIGDGAHVPSGEVVERSVVGVRNSRHLD